MLNSMYIVSNTALNEDPIPSITGKYSVIDYIYDGIHLDEYDPTEELESPVPTASTDA